MCVVEKLSERNSFVMARMRANCTSFSSSPKSLSLSGEPVDNFEIILAGNSKLLQYSTVVALQVCLERLAPLVGDDDGGVDVLLALVVAQVRDPPLSQLALHGEFELRSG